MGFGPGGGGGSSSIGGSTDVALSNPANNEVLTYDAGVGKWKNAVISGGGSTPDATTSTKGKLQLAGDLGGTADAPTVPGLSGKADDTAVVHVSGNESVAGTKNFTGILQAGGQTVVTTNDTRLSDARTPTDGSVAYAKLSAGGATTGQVLSYNGSALAWTTPGGLVATAVKTANYTAAAGEYVPVNTTSASVTITLPTAPTDGTQVAVKVVSGSNSCVVSRGGSTDVFNVASGATTLTLTSLGLGVTLRYASSVGIWYSLDSTPLSALNGTYAPYTGPVPAAYAASADSRFYAAPASKKVADFTLALADAGSVIEVEGASNVNVTVPSSASVAFQDNTIIELSQTGAGQAILVPGSNVTLHNSGGLKTRVQWSSLSLRKRPGTGSALPTTNMLMRYKGDDLTGANGSAVSSWPESSGNNLPAAVQGTTANQPTLKTNAMNGHTGVAFNGTSQYLNLTGSVLNLAQNISTLCVFAVYTCNTVSSGVRSLFTLSTGTSSLNARIAVRHRDGSGNSVMSARRLDTDGSVVATGSAVTAGENVVLTGVFNYAGGAEVLYKNGTQAATATVTSGTTSNTSSLAGCIGANPNGSAETFYGNIMEVIAYSAIDATTRAAVDTYFQVTYGISLADASSGLDEWVVTGDTAV